MIPKIRIGNITTEGCKAGVLVEINGEPCDGVQSAKVSLDCQGFTCATIEFTGDVGFIGDTKEYDKKTEENKGEYQYQNDKLTESITTMQKYCDSREHCCECKFYGRYCEGSMAGSPSRWFLENIVLENLK